MARGRLSSESPDRFARDLRVCGLDGLGFALSEGKINRPLEANEGLLAWLAALWRVFVMALLADASDAAIAALGDA